MSSHLKSDGQSEVTAHAAPRLRWLPRSLFGRLMGVLSLGLLAALLLSTWINLAERDRMMLRAAGAHPAQRVAEVVRLLDSLEPAEQDRVASILNQPGQRVRLASASRESGRPADGASASDSEADDTGPQAGVVMALLRASLGPDRPIIVRAHPVGPGAERADRGWWGRHRPGNAGNSGDSAGVHPPHPGLVLNVQVQLANQRWLLLDSRLAADTASLPVRMLATLGVLLVSVLLLSWLAVRWLTRPLQVLAVQAEALGTDLHRPPLPESGPAEVQQAARAMNTMQQRLVATLEGRTRVLTAISHDLKTPLTRMRLRAELLDDEALRERFDKDLLDMEAMVHDALALLRGLDEPAQRLSIDMNALLQAVQADQQEMGRSVSLSGEATAPFEGDPGRLRRCIGNLVDNAVLYGQRAHIEVTDDTSALLIRIRDEGPGIPPAALAQVFEPFFRLEASRNRATGGSGLGLGIARELARSAGGDVTLSNHPGGGLVAQLSLPRGRG